MTFKSKQDLIFKNLFEKSTISHINLFIIDIVVGKGRDGQRDVSVGGLFRIVLCIASGMVPKLPRHCKYVVCCSFCSLFAFSQIKHKKKTVNPRGTCSDKIYYSNLWDSVQRACIPNFNVLAWKLTNFSNYVQECVSQWVSVCVSVWGTQLV